MDTEKEKSRTEREHSDESGHSEKQSDLDTEIKAGEWQGLRKHPVFQKRSRQGKIIAMHEAVSNRLKQLERLYYPLVGNHPEKALKLLEELKRLRLMQEYLLQCLVWEEKNELTSDLVPIEVWNLIQ
jgi:hypothetical protein